MCVRPAFLHPQDSLWAFAIFYPWEPQALTVGPFHSQRPAAPTSARERKAAVGVGMELGAGRRVGKGVLLQPPPCPSRRAHPVETSFVAPEVP